MDKKDEYSRKRIEAEHQIINMRKSIKSNKLKIDSLKRQIEHLRSETGVLEASIVVKVQELAKINTILDLSKRPHEIEKEERRLKANETLLKLREKYNF